VQNIKDNRIFLFWSTWILTWHKYSCKSHSTDHSR